MKNDILTDELLECAAQKACEYDEDFLSDIEQHEFSPEFNYKMEVLIKGNEPLQYYGTKKIKIRILLIAALLLVVSLRVVMAKETVEEKNSTCQVQVLRGEVNMIVKLYDDHADIELDLPENYKGNPKFEYMKPTYIPKGYKFNKEDNTFSGNYHISYINQKEQALHYSQIVWEKFGYPAYSADGIPVRGLNIDGYPAYWIPNSNGYNILLYVREGYIFDVGGRMEVEELIRVIESLEKFEK